MEKKFDDEWGEKTRKIGHSLCDTFVAENYKENRFDGGEYMGGNTDTGIYGRWYYDKNGYVLKLVADAKNGVIVSSELSKI